MAGCSKQGSPVKQWQRRAKGLANVLDPTVDSTMVDELTRSRYPHRYDGPSTFPTQWKKKGDFNSWNKILAQSVEAIQQTR